MRKLKLGSLFDGLYKIAEDGRVYSTRTKKWLKPSTDKYGYLYYVISINGKRSTFKAHKAVATCFIPNTDSKPTVDHIDGNKKNNAVSNLRWATYKEQQHNAITLERAKLVHDATDYYTMGLKRNFGRKTVNVYRDDVLIGTYASLKEAVSICGGNYSKASECAHGKRKKTGGLKYCYV